MPKIVDHDARRERIVDAVWTIVARRGFDALTMRELAHEVGVANGALARYFPDKESILRAAFHRAYAATSVRAQRAIGDRTGIEAFRLLCLEIMPLDAERLAEARVVIGFWDYAATNPDLIAMFDNAVSEWRDEMGSYLRQGQDTHDVSTKIDIAAAVDLTMAAMMGLQVNAIFSAARNTDARQLHVLDSLLDSLRPQGSSTRTGGEGCMNAPGHRYIDS